MTTTEQRPAYLDAITVYRRSRRGDTIHRATCPRANPDKTLPWLWAEGKSRTELEDACTDNGLHPCKVCNPTHWLPPLTAEEFADGCGYVYRGIPLVENEDATHVFAYGHIDPALFAGAVNDMDAELADALPYTPEMVHHVYATTERPATHTEGWWITWGGQPENTADTPGAFPITVVDR